MIDDPLFTFDEELHKYFYDRLEIPGSTSLLREFGILDFSGIPEDRLEYKRQLGTAVHLATSLSDMGQLDENTVDERIAGYVLAWEKFRRVTGFVPAFNETRLFSKKLRFAGTLDRQGLLEGYESLLDIKCAWELYRSTGPQLSSYQILFEENFKIKIKKRYGVKLQENGNYELVEYKDPLDKSIFLSCLQLHYWRKKYGGKNGNASAIDE